MVAAVVISVETNCDPMIKLVLEEFGTDNPIEVRIVGGGSFNFDSGLSAQAACNPLLSALKVHPVFNVRSFDCFKKIHPHAIVIQPSDGSIAPMVPAKVDLELAISRFETWHPEFYKNELGLVKSIVAQSASGTIVGTTQAMNVTKGFSVDANGKINYNHGQVSKGVPPLFLEASKELIKALVSPCKAEYSNSGYDASRSWFDAKGKLGLYEYFKAHKPDIYKTCLTTAVNFACKSMKINLTSEQVDYLKHQIIECKVPILHRMTTFMTALTAKMSKDGCDNVNEAIHSLCHEWSSETARYNEMESTLYTVGQASASAAEDEDSESAVAACDSLATPDAEQVSETSAAAGGFPELDSVTLMAKPAEEFE